MRAIVLAAVTTLSSACGDFMHYGYDGYVNTFDSPPTYTVYSCSLAYNGTPDGMAICSGGAWTHNLTGCYPNAPNATCSGADLAARGGYVPSPACRAPTEVYPESVCRLADCDYANGYKKIEHYPVSASFVCYENGSWIQENEGYGCYMPEPQPTPPAGYEIEMCYMLDNQSMMIPGRSSCNIRCAPGYMGTPANTTYMVGPYAQPFFYEGCYAPPCLNAFEGTAEIGAGTCIDKEHGFVCQPECRSPMYAGVVRGTVQCVLGNWTVVGSSALSGCTVARCPAYTQAGYVSTTCGAGTTTGTQCTGRCAAGYVGTANGSVACQHGEYTGEFTGCSVAPAAECATAYTQAGYTVSGCGAKTPHNTSCTATACASGYSGAPGGNVWCEGLEYVGAFSGCTRTSDCALPGWLCAVGGVKDGYELKSYGTMGAVEQRGCVVWDNTIMQVTCAPGYTLVQGSLQTSVCLNGVLISQARPTCSLVPAENCVCGSSGTVKKDAQLNSGRVRGMSGGVPPGWNGPGHKCWMDQVDGKKELRCFCRCHE